jgi:hypothetical protein
MSIQEKLHSSSKKELVEKCLSGEFIPLVGHSVETFRYIAFSKENNPEYSLDEVVLAIIVDSKNQIHWYTAPIIDSHPICTYVITFNDNGSLGIMKEFYGISLSDEREKNLREGKNIVSGRGVFCDYIYCYTLITKEFLKTFFIV